MILPTGGVMTVLPGRGVVWGLMWQVLAKSVLDRLELPDPSTLPVCNYLGLGNRKH